MIAAYHLVWTAYGWWLPKDPRGSGSQSIRCNEIGELGPVYLGRKPVRLPSAAVRAFYNNARHALKHELLKFSAGEFVDIEKIFADVVRSRTYTCYVCALMPNHVHLLIRRHRDRPDEMIANLQKASRAAILTRGERDRNHPVWGGPGWTVYWETRETIVRTVRYIENNPPKAHRAAQQWPFVKRV